MKDGGLIKSEWVVLPVDIANARRIITQFHYSKGATNTGVYIHGLFRKEDIKMGSNCMGVAWWLPPTKNAAIATFDGDWRKVLSLTRLAINPVVPKNGASFLLSQSIKMIDQCKWNCLVTYADTWREHTGAIYKATNWQYMGETKPTPVFQNKEGKMMGRKRGGKNLTVQELNKLGYYMVGKFSKHKFRMVLQCNKNKRTKILNQPSLFDLL